ncbi:MAG: hypothetical protein GF317_17850 [Candidatus Lokiarchaeota archaeon]|nr:hypothetical protein [Candidatus Lokiarchaeota archaeon]MBD3201377.1 hypothetical protein [Candidatus Lokiarchaeota archaeon]
MNKKEENGSEDEYLSDEDMELSVPLVPEAPKQKSLKPDLHSEVIGDMERLKGPGKKVILVNCGRCKRVIAIPVPKKIVENSEIPVVPISFVHKNGENEDQHCITIYVDHDYDVRRQRLSDVILS